MKDVLPCLKYFPLNFTCGVRYLLTHFREKLHYGVDGFLIPFSEIFLDLYK